MNLIRLVVSFFSAVGIQVFIAAMSKYMFSNFTFVVNVNFLLNLFLIFGVAMLVCITFVLIIERLLRVGRLGAHVISTIALTTLAISYQLSEARITNLAFEMIITLVLCSAISFVTYFFFRFGEVAAPKV